MTSDQADMVHLCLGVLLCVLEPNPCSFAGHLCNTKSHCLFIVPNCSITQFFGGKLVHTINSDSNVCK